MVTISTGCKCVDKFIGGGILPENVVLIYGEPETGKTTLAIQCAVNCALQNLKTLFVDCENTFSTKRTSQIAKDKFDQVAEQIILIKPKDFPEQTAVIDRIQDYTAKNFGLIIIDTLTSLYGAEVAEYSDKAFSVNRELNRQLAILAQTARIRKIPVVVLSQVRSVFDNENVTVAPVANRVLKFWADTIIYLKPSQFPQILKAVIEKTPGNSREISCYVQILESGIQDTEIRE
ncbi:MAG: AAA family ATPase [Nitrososphaerales archaeon]|jgi:RecA/RadA recombinase